MQNQEQSKANSCPSENSSEGKKNCKQTSLKKAYYEKQTSPLSKDFLSNESFSLQKNGTKFEWVLEKGQNFVD